MKRVVLTDRVSYLQERNFAGLSFEKYKVTEGKNIYRFLDYIARKWDILQRRDRYKYSFRNFGLHRADLCHFFNTVSFDQRPWLVSFSDRVPFWREAEMDELRIGVEKLASSSCKSLIALSSCTARIQGHFLRTSFPEYADSIIGKMDVVHPAQEALVESYDQKRVESGPIEFTMVGIQFFRKGGKELILAFENLLSRNLPLRLNLVTRIRNVVGSRVPEADYDHVSKVLERFADRIIQHGKMPNNQVLDLLERSHVAVLPTYHDTYGYFVLEAQASGCPVITTDVRALPEINSNRVGWVIEVPKDEYGNALYRGHEENNPHSKIVVQRLVEIIEDIVQNPDQVRERGQRAIDRVRRNHSPVEKAQVIERMYDDALQS